MSITARNLVQEAFEAAGILASGQPLSATDANKGLIILNELLEEYSLMPTTMYNLNEVSLDLEAGKYTYTIGPDGDLNIPRPSRLVAAVQNVNGFDYPIELIDKDTYNNIFNKYIEASLIQHLFVKHTYPQLEVYVWPIPTETHTVRIDCWYVFNSLTLNTVLDFPYGYKKALKLNTAVMLRIMYKLTTKQDLVTAAVDAKAVIQRVNNTTPLMTIDVCRKM